MADRLKVVIIGAGIGGCSAALALRQNGCDVDVYEQAANKTDVGAGIQISPNASRLLDRYGLTAQLDAVAVRPVAIECRRWENGRLLSREDLGEPVAQAYGAPYYHFHRADLLRILSGAIPRQRLHHGVRCVGVTQDGRRARAEFHDGSFADGDLVIGADGIHSEVRQQLFGAEHPRFSGNVAFRGLVPAEKIAHLGIERVSTVWMGPGGHFVHYFVSGGRHLNFVAVTEQARWSRESWTDQADVAEAHVYYRGWHPQIHAILDGVEQTFKWALFDRDPLEKWSVGRVALLGDACHPMLPYMAQGAAQSIEDGATLAACLHDAASADVAALLETYQAMTKPRTSRIQSLARHNAETFHLPDGPAQQSRDAGMAEGAKSTNPSALDSTRAMIFAHDAGRAVTRI